MSRREMVFVRSLTKDALGGRGTIELRRNRSGEMFYSTRHVDGFATWHLYPKGEEWLTLHGFGEGDKIDLAVALYLHKNDLSHTGKSKQPVRSSQSTGDTAQARERFDWAAANSVDQRLGKIRGDTVTVHADGSVTTSSEVDAFLPQSSSVRGTAQARRPTTGSRRPQDIKLRKEIAELVESTREFERSRAALGADQVIDRKKRKEPARFSNPAPGPAVAHGRSHRERNNERQPKGGATTVHVAFQTGRSEVKSPSSSVDNKEKLVESIMAKLASSLDEQPRSNELRGAPVGVPRKLLKKAARRKARQ